MRKQGFLSEIYKPEHIKLILPRVMDHIWLKYTHCPMSKISKGVEEIHRACWQRKNGIYERQAGEETESIKNRRGMERERRKWSAR